MKIKRTNTKFTDSEFFWKIRYIYIIMVNFKRINRNS